MPDDNFVKVLVPLRLDWIPVYRSSEPLERGQAVNVIFSGRRYTGVVWDGHSAPDIDLKRIRPIISKAEEIPDTGEDEMKFWEFLSEYYMCSLGEVYKAARPVFYARRARMSAAATERLKLRLAATEAELQKKHRSEAVVQRLTGLRDRIAEQLEQAVPARVSPGSFIRQVRPPKPLALSGPERSGRYVQAIREALDRNGQILVLAPELAFCSRLEELLRPFFGEAVRTISPEQKENARSRLAYDLRRGKSLVAVGTKTAIFLPFSRLALIIVDEEQDPLYKQNDSAPRYNGRDAAIKLAELHSAPVILGSSCLSLETEYNCMTGKFRLEPCGGRSGEVEIIDTSAEKRKNGMSGYFSHKLSAAIRTCNGPVTIIRGWEKPDELSAEIARLFPGKDTCILTLNELKRNGCGNPSMIAVVQADALVSRDDFRSDERAMQIVELMRGLAPKVVIQTTLHERFDGSKTVASLLAERKEFNFPPYSRLVEIRREGSGEVLERHFLKRDLKLAAHKAEILAKIPETCYPDVDPA